MNRRRFLKNSAGVLVPLSFGIITSAKGQANFQLQQQIAAAGVAAASSSSGIQRISSASAQANSVSITTPTAGDCILVFAHRDGSATAPSEITGYTTIDASGANTNAARLMFKISDGTETTSGTSTNATSIAVIVYRGTDPTYPVGQFLVGGASSTSVAFNTLSPSLWEIASSSWVAGFAAHRTATNLNQAPTGMTLQTSATDIGASDTNGTATSWSTQSITVNANSGWRSYAVEIRTAPAADSPPSTDLLVQHVCGANTGGGQVPMTALDVYLPNDSLSGNCLVVSLSHFGGLTMAAGDIADNKGNTWVVAQQVTDGTNSWSVTQFVCANATAGTNHITITKAFHTGSGGCIQAQVAEFYGIATSSAVDNQGGAGPLTAPSLQPGSFTTTTDGCLIYQVAFNETQFITGSQPMIQRVVKGESGYALLSADLLDGASAQYGIQTTHGAINPVLFCGVPNSANANGRNVFITAAVALKVSAGAGTAPSGMRIVRAQELNLFLRSATTSNPVQFPCSGNLILAAWIGFDHTGGVPRALASASDQYNSSYSNTGAGVSNGGGDVSFFYKGSAVTHPSMIGPTFVTSGGVQEQSNCLLYDIAGASASPFDVDATASGTQSVPGDLTTVTITPTTSGGIIFSQVGVDLNSIGGLSGSSFRFDAMTYPEEVGSKNFYEDNGVGHIVNTSTSSKTFIWTTLNNPSGVEAWAARAAAFK